MSRNIEIKARIASVEAMLPVAAALSNGGPMTITQDDTFFRCDTGRLKLRMFSEGDGELIFYRRDDQAGPKQSFYLRSPTSDPLVLRESLSLAYGVVGRVRKQRLLFLSGRTRIHLDRVEGLGDFLELEVVLAEDEALTQGEAAREGEAATRGEQEAIELMRKLGVEPAQLIDVAYVDLLASAGVARASGAARARDPS